MGHVNYCRLNWVSKRIVTLDSEPFSSHSNNYQAHSMSHFYTFRSMQAVHLHESLRQMVWDSHQCEFLASLVLRMSECAPGPEFLARKGVLIQAVLGGGKTSILQVLQDSLINRHVIRLDCANLSLLNR